MSESTTKISDWVLYKNNQLIAFNKPATIPVQPDKTEAKSLLELGEIYAKSTIFLIHRIDRPASGVVLFAKSKKGLARLNQQFQNRTIQKTYLAVVKNAPKTKKGTLRHFIQKNGKTNKAQVFDEMIKGGKEAILHYETVGESDNYTLLKVEIETGRHHQIRAQLAKIGSPIKGDVKYGARRSNKDRSIHLHAWKLTFKHPVTEERIMLTADLPEDTIWQFFAGSLQ
ncbi:MAG: RNA pseudouridine synthase [Bacteroidota bacterium]